MNEIIDPNNLNLAAFSSKKKGQKSLARTYCAEDLLKFFQKEGLGTQDACDLLRTNITRWGYLTKRSQDGRPLSNEHIPPTIEMYIRLLEENPEFKPWSKNITLEYVMKKHNLKGVELAAVCGVNEATGRIWDKRASEINVAPVMQELLVLLDKILTKGKSFKTIQAIAKKSINYRSITNKTENQYKNSNWSSDLDRDLKSIKKTLEKCLKDIAHKLYPINTQSENKKLLTTWLLKFIKTDEPESTEFIEEITEKIYRLDQHDSLNEVVTTLKHIEQWLQTRSEYMQLVHQREVKREFLGVDLNKKSLEKCTELKAENEEVELCHKTLNDLYKLCATSK